MHGYMLRCSYLLFRQVHAVSMNALQIYGVTKYLDDHPGGADVLLEVTGTDNPPLILCFFFQ